MSERIDLAIEAWHDGTLDAAGAELLAGALRADPAVRERLAMAGLLGQAFADDAAIARSIDERIHAEGSASALVRAVQQAIPPRRRARRTATTGGWWAAAAALLIALGAGWWLAGQRGTPAPVVECRLVETTGVTVERAGATVSGTEGLVAGDRVTATTGAVLRWADGSEVELTPGSRAALVRPGAGPGLRLEAGDLDAIIAPQRAGAPFAIATAGARVEVLGTRFRLAVAGAATRCDLRQGAVRMTRLTDGRGLDLSAGQSLTVAPGVAFAVVGAPPAAPAPPTPPTWQPLFPSADLAGWQQQHGAWSNAGGTVRGSGGARRKARLLSRTAFADLELSCRLRITGADFAEVQVGDYNWFVEVPARGGAWVELRLSQRGAAFSATADGVALTPQAGDGAAMRAGPLGFYVMPGGTLEIADARIHLPDP